MKLVELAHGERKWAHEPAGPPGNVYVSGAKSKGKRRLRECGRWPNTRNAAIPLNTGARSVKVAHLCS